MDPPFGHDFLLTSQSDEDVGSHVDKPSYATRGVGLTPRLFKALQEDSQATLPAMDRAYVESINQHVQSVSPSKQVMAEYWCPIVVEDAVGTRAIFHVDPISLRKFRRSIAEELKHVQSKRRRMLKRIQDIRQRLPPPCPRVVAMRLTRELSNAEEMALEPLIKPLSRSARVLHVFVEASSRMMQLELVCNRLAEELPKIMQDAEVQYITLRILHSRSDKVAASYGMPASLEEPVNCAEPSAWEQLRCWLKALGTSKREGKSNANVCGGLKLARPLEDVAKTADMFGLDGTSVLVVACSPVADIEKSAELLAKTNMCCQFVGVFGLSPEDPEPGLRRLAVSAGRGSSLHLFFGPDYWHRFAAVQKQRLSKLMQDDPSVAFAITNGTLAASGEDESNEVVDPKVFEMRLIERVMRQCYVEEQQCEKELRCAGQVLARTLVPPQEIAEAMVHQCVVLQPPVK